MDLPTLCQTLTAHAHSIAARVVRRWEEIAGAEPWLALPADLDFDHLPDLIRALAAAALCTEYDHTLCREAMEAAAGHGAHRAKQGFGENLIHREYHLLRRALAFSMKDEHGESAAVYYATMRLDALMSLMSAAALHGLHRQAFDDEGRWPAVLDELLDGWPLSPP